MRLLSRFLVNGLFFVAAVIIISGSAPTQAADKEDCLMCHKHRFLGRIDESGRKMNYNVDEDIYQNTVHRNVACRDCHPYIKKIPHDPVTEEVNCANECHIKPPFATENFSHQRIIDIYNKSRHGIKPTDSPELREAKPYCKYCHLNPIYLRVDEERVAFDETLRRCLNCHQKDGVTQAYKHMTHRLRKKTSRPPKEIVQLCAKNCHQDVELMKRLNVPEISLEAVETYKNSIHGKAVALGSKVSADCISCHATSSIHDIYKRDDPESTINKENLQNTCRQCHDKVNEEFIKIGVHPSVKREEKPILFFGSMALEFALYGAVFGLVGLMLLETWGRRSDGIKFQLKNGTTWRGPSKRKARFK